MKILFFFIDGIGLGKNDPSINPFAAANLPILENLLSGRKMVTRNSPYHGTRASLLGIDACLNVQGVPQSATGQAALLTGRNIPEEVGYHFGPWPNQLVVDSLKQGNIFGYLRSNGFQVGFLNAYPPSYFEAINSGKRLYSVMPQAAISAGIPLKTKLDLELGLALSADFTARGWIDHLKLENVPIITPYEAGLRLAQLTNEYDFSLFEYWLSDYAGHEQDMDKALSILNSFDEVLRGLLASWNDAEGLVIITSDHGNMEDLSTRRHTTNEVPALLIGSPNIRSKFINKIRRITDITPSILASFNVDFDQSQFTSANRAN